MLEDLPVTEQSTTQKAKAPHCNKCYYEIPEVVFFISIKGKC